MPKQYGMLPGFAPQFDEDAPPGPVELGVVAEIEHKKRAGLIDENYSGWTALAIRAARDVDRSAGVGAPSGRAKLLEVLNGILENLPAPEVVQTSDLDKALEAILDR